MRINNQAYGAMLWFKEQGFSNEKISRAFNVHRTTVAHLKARHPDLASTVPTEEQLATMAEVERNFDPELAHRLAMERRKQDQG